MDFLIESSCAQSGQSIQIEIDDRLAYHVRQTEADPILFIPIVDFETLDDPSIIDAF